jgi:hypothetical protein
MSDGMTWSVDENVRCRCGATGLLSFAHAPAFSIRISTLATRIRRLMHIFCGAFGDGRL